MAGSAEILKAYVSLNADTTGLRADLNKASAEVEAWKRKSQSKVPLSPGVGPGGVSPGAPGGPIDQTTQATGRMEQAVNRATDANDRHTESIHRQRTAYGRLMGTVTLLVGTFVSMYNIGKRITEMFGKSGKDAALDFAASLNYVGDAAKGSFLQLQKQIDDLQRRVSAFQERGFIIGSLFDIDASRGVVQSQLQELKNLEKGLALQQAALKNQREKAQFQEDVRRGAEREYESQRQYMLELDRAEQKRRENWREWLDEMRRGLMSLPAAIETANAKMAAQMRSDFTAAITDINRQLDSATNQRIASRIEVVAQQIQALVAVTRRSR